jgi:hypothetical protein
LNLEPARRYGGENFSNPAKKNPPGSTQDWRWVNFLAKSRLPEGYADLITSLYHDCKKWYEKGRALEKMYEDERARCALLESDLARKTDQLRKFFETISPLVSESWKSINVWREEIANSPVPSKTDTTPLAVDRAPINLLDGIKISSLYETAVFGAEIVNLISSRGLGFMLQWQEDGSVKVDQTIHLFKIDTGNQSIQDKYARKISSGLCLLQYDLQLCLKKAFGDSSVKNFGNYTQRTNKFVLSKAELLPKLTDTTIDELTSKKIIIGNKPNQEYCFIPYAEVAQVLTKFGQHSCRHPQTIARLDCIKSLLDKFKSRHVSNEELSLDGSDGLSHLSQSSEST